MLLSFLFLRRCAVLPLVYVILAFAFIAVPHSKALAQSDLSEMKREEKLRKEALEALGTLESLLGSKAEKSEQLEALKRELKAVKEPALKKEVEGKIKAETEKLEQIDKQLAALATGISEDEIQSDQNEKFELQAELESLVQPFVKMMKDATENARQIEKLKRTLLSAEKQQRLAQRSIERLQLLSSVESSRKAESGDAGPKNSQALAHLKKLLKTWQDREQAAKDLEETAEQQLSVRMDEQSRSSGGLGTYATEFFRNRGLNLLLAIAAFGGVFVIMGVIARVAGWIQRRQGIPRSFATRLAGLLYKVATTIAAFLAMLAVFNIMNDWLLLGIASLFALAMAWIGLKMLPNIAEQITLLLNLGAVQEGERLLFAGVPWQVRRLDFYTDLENPALDGGTFTLACA